jgi:hypothetical protein
MCLGYRLLSGVGGHRIFLCFWAQDIITAQLIPYAKKCQLLNTLEWFHIYNLSKHKQQMNDTFADIHDPIFVLIINTHWSNITNNSTN